MVINVILKPKSKLSRVPSGWESFQISLGPTALTSNKEEGEREGEKIYIISQKLHQAQEWIKWCPLPTPRHIRVYRASRCGLTWK